MKRYIFIFVIFLVFVFGQVFLAGNQVSLGDQIFNINKLVDQAKLVNSELEKEIATESSYKNISEKAEELNFQIASVMQVKNGEVAFKR